MKISLLCLFAPIVSIGLALPQEASSSQGSYSQYASDRLASKALTNLQNYSNRRPNSKCNSQNVAVRREWSTLSRTEKKSYLDAVLCLSQKRPKTPFAEWPGVRGRYDDFVATHINQTLIIHGTTSFLSWHRYFTWAYEKALREECGYRGYQPYYNWVKYANDPLRAPAFDGSDVSFGSNGVYANVTDVPSSTLFPIPHQQGAGCIKDGAFKDFKANLGPLAPLYAEVPANPLENGRGYNPRCLRRDLSRLVSSQSTTDANVTALISNSANVADFQTSMEFNGPNGLNGVHSGGHFTWGGDPGGDFFVSPGDPIFYMHHAAIDRTWWTWQNVEAANLEARTFQVGLTVTIFNQPPSRPGTLDDWMDLGVNAPAIQLKNAMSSMGYGGSPFCYVYV